MGMGFWKAVATVSFKSKYLAVAVIAAVAVALAVGFVLVLQNRAQHSALLDSAAADSRARIQRELSLRAAEIAQRIAERVNNDVLTGDHAAVDADVESFKG